MASGILKNNSDKMEKKQEHLSKKEYILRGGLAGSIFFAIYIFTLHYIPEFKRFPCVDETYGFFNCFGIKFFQIIGKPAYLVVKNITFLNEMGTEAQGIFAIIFLLAFYFALGSIVGYLYWIIKRRRKENED